MSGFSITFITRPHRMHRCAFLDRLSVCVLDTAVSRTKTAEPVEMPFQLWTRVGPRNRVLGRAPSPGEEAILAGFQPTEKCYNSKVCNDSRMLSFTIKICCPQQYTAVVC